MATVATSLTSCPHCAKLRLYPPPTIILNGKIIFRRLKNEEYFGIIEKVPNENEESQKIQNGDQETSSTQTKFTVDNQRNTGDEDNLPNDSNVIKLVNVLKGTLNKLIEDEDIKRVESICKNKIEEVENIIKNNNDLKNEYKLFFEMIVGYLYKLAALYEENRKGIEAEGSFRQALDICEKYLKDPMKTSEAFENLGSWYLHFKRYEEAENLLEQALKLRNSISNNQNRENELLIFKLSILYKYSKSEDEANIYYEKGKKLLEKNYPTDSLELADKYTKLGKIYATQKMHNEAQIFHEKASNICEKILGTDHSKTAETYCELVYIHAIKRNFEQAEILCKKTLDIMLKMFDSDHYNLVLPYKEMAYIFQKTNRFEESEFYNKKALAIIEAKYGVDSIKTIDILKEWAWTYIDKGEPRNAELHMERALRIIEKNLGKENIIYADFCQSFAYAFGKLYQTNKTENLAKESLQIRKIICPTHISIIKDYEILAYIYSISKNFAKSEEMAKKAISIIESQLGTDNIKLATPYKTLAITYKRTKRFKEAEEFIKKSIILNEREYGPEDERTKKTRQELNSIVLLASKSNRTIESLVRLDW